MKTSIIFAVILIAIGIVSLGYQGITYTTREKVIDIGPVTMTADKKNTISVPPIIGAIALVGGIGLLVLGRKET